MINRAHLRVIQGNPAPVREWSQRPANLRLVQEFARAHCPDCEWHKGTVALLVMLLVCSNAVWVILLLVRKGIIE